LNLLRFKASSFLRQCAELAELCPNGSETVYKKFHVPDRSSLQHKMP